MDKTRNHSSESSALTLGGRPLSIVDVCAVARGAQVNLSTESTFRQRIDVGARILADNIAAGRPIYGVTTGYGDSCTVSIPPRVLDELPVHLINYHGCGLGQYFDEPTAAAILVTRLTSLAAGFSGVRFEVLQQLQAFLQ
ncbi:MAG TPA: aromatic amino acid lyase, partial [Gammaproteobacteria bacterium]|nr:aromatic amino acid lyase [Gammaproteobacteria bacterium]